MGEDHTERLILRIRLSVGDPAVRQMVATATAAFAVVACAIVLRHEPIRPGQVLSNGVLVLRACSFQFCLFAGLAVLATSTSGRRLRFLAMGGLALLAAGLQILVRPGDLFDQLLCWTASSAGILAGPALAEALTLVMRRFNDQRRRQMIERDPTAAASEWFVQLHRTEPDAFDWTSFDSWIRQSRAHRQAYDRIEALWYEMDDHKAELQARAKSGSVGGRPLLGLALQSAMTFIGSARSQDGGLALARLCIITLAWTLAAATS